MNDIEILQEKISYQERTIETLNDALTNQQQQLTRMQEKLQILTGLVNQWRAENRTGGELEGDSMMQELPPHY